MASLEQLTIDIHMKATEDAEKFVFETVSPYVNDQLKVTITKQELLDAFRAKKELDYLKQLIPGMLVEECKYKVGDAIWCNNKEQMLYFMRVLECEGFETEFLYEKNGVKGLWLEITEV